MVVSTPWTGAGQRKTGTYHVGGDEGGQVQRRGAVEREVVLDQTVRALCSEHVFVRVGGEGTYTWAVISRSWGC
jgi:hypothetical protein